MPQVNIFNPFKNLLNKLVPAQLDQQSAQWCSDRHSNYYNAAYGTPTGSAVGLKAGASFFGANQTGASLSGGLTTTYTGLCLSNPATSTLNLIVHKIFGQIVVAPAGLLALGLISGWSTAGIVTHTTPLNTSILNSYIGAATANGSILGPASIANLDAACTIVGTPLWTAWTATNVASTNSPGFILDVGDGIIIPPGGYLAVSSNTAGPTNGFFGTFFWEELIS